MAQLFAIALLGGVGTGHDVAAQSQDEPADACQTLIDSFFGMRETGGDPSMLSAAFARDGCIVPLVDRWLAASDARDEALSEVGRLNGEVVGLNARIVELEARKSTPVSPKPQEDELGVELLERMTTLIEALESFEFPANDEARDGEVPVPKGRSSEAPEVGADGAKSIDQIIDEFAQAVIDGGFAGDCDKPRIERVGIAGEANSTTFLLIGSVASPEDFNSVVEMARQSVVPSVRNELELRPAASMCFTQVGSYHVRLTEDGDLLSSNEEGVYGPFFDTLPDVAACDEINALLENDEALAEWRETTPEFARGAWVRQGRFAAACAWTDRGYGINFQPNQIQSFLVMEPS